jgi:pimeloyl-ACP methyl ester carboxylesterase
MSGSAFLARGRDGNAGLVEELVTVELACNDSGAGSPLVILHGLLGAKRNWATVAKALASRRRVLWADLRNHGASPWHDDHTYPAMAADVVRLIEQRVGGPATVLGHSMGGKVAMLVALTRPDLVKPWAQCSATGDPPWRGRFGAVAGDAMRFERKRDAPAQTTQARPQRA